MMDKLTTSEIRKIFKRSNLDKNFCNELSQLLHDYGSNFKIDTPIRRVRFLAQAVHEVGIKRNGTVRMRENMNYSYKTLIAVSKYFRHHKELAKKYSRHNGHKANQKAIANIMYADKNRPKHLRLGNVRKGDGYAFRGMFMFQSTGRYNVMNDIDHLNQTIGIVLVDENNKLYNDAINSYTIFILGGMAHWHRTKMHKLKSTNAVTNKINRGLPAKMKRERLATAIRVKKFLLA